MVSTSTLSVSIFMSLKVTLVTMPVRPMPPMVAQNSSGSAVGETVTAPRGVTRRISSTWSPIEPSRWWFLPWTSAATAPPMVT